MNKSNLLLVIILSCLSSCTIYKEYPIDIFRPGETALPPDVENITVFSRNFKYSNDTLQGYYQSDFKLKKDREHSADEIDSSAVSAAMRGLASGLENSGKYKNIKILPYSLVKPHRGGKLPVLNWETAQNIAGQTGADALISLETLSCFFSTYSSSATEGLPKNEVITVAVWCVYDPELKKVIDRKQMIDTVFWCQYDEELEREMDLPPRLDAVKIACELAGGNFANRFVPSWQKVYRMYVLPPVEDFRVAAQYFEKGEWENAIKIWNIYAPEKFRRLSINARYNMALGYEMADDFENSLYWIDKANEMAASLKSREDLRMIGLYKKVLIDRQEEMAKLNQ